MTNLWEETLRELGTYGYVINLDFEYDGIPAVLQCRLMLREE